MNDKVKIAWWGKHFGEEPPLVGTKDQGAGGIFFSGCHLHCIFCQNYQISQEDFGQDYSIEDLIEIMLKLQDQDAINIDLVTPTIW
jgi:putative pyruvate formate lyase activating enzyme